jgi:hypothetical protein
VAVVELVGGTIGIPGLTENEDVVTKAEGVRVDGNGTEVHIGVVTGSLAGRGTIEVPLRELINGLDGLGESLLAGEKEVSPGQIGDESRGSGWVQAQMWHAAKSPCVGLIGQGETSAITAEGSPSIAWNTNHAPHGNLVVR